MIATNYAPANLHQGWNSHRHIWRNNAAPDKTGWLEQTLTQKAHSAFTEVLDAAGKLGRSAFRLLRRGQRATMHFQRVREPNVLTSLSLKGARHPVIMREP